MATATATANRPSGPVLSTPSYRSASPTRVNLPARSPGKSVSVSSPKQVPTAAPKIRRSSCMCSPTNHPGSFRCGLHKDRKQAAPAGSSTRPASPPSTSKSTGSALARLVPMGSGHWARRALAPSPAAQHRRRAGGFRHRPSRLSAVSMAGDSQ